MKIHLIAVGGSIMHNLALALHHHGHQVTGSDDEIYEPSKSRLAADGLLPDKMGWNVDFIHDELDMVILGMHARPDNPELLAAKEKGLRICSFPEFIYEHAKDKKRIVVGGSHGKTTTSAMILHVLKEMKIDCDYLVGAKLEGFDLMVRLSDAPVMVIEGDEYLASPIDRRPKFHLYKANIAILTGISWDHINVFPTYEMYKEQFRVFMETLDENASLFWFQGDSELEGLSKNLRADIKSKSYNTPPYKLIGDAAYWVLDGKEYMLQVFGTHNLQNMESARLACAELGVSSKDFVKSMQCFQGAAKRLQKILEWEGGQAYLDFAHAPSKVEATCWAMKEQFPEKKLLAVFELHTFSSLNAAFHHQYEKRLNAADEAWIYYDDHALEMKKLPALNKTKVGKEFSHPNMKVFNSPEQLRAAIRKQKDSEQNILFMSSGNFGGLNILKELGDDI